MQKNHTATGYDHSSYDAHFCLKPSLMLWITMLYLSRAIVLPIFAQLADLGGSETKTLMRGLFDVYALLPALLAVVVLAALPLRSPSRGRVVRWVWARGRAFLALSAILDLALPWANSFLRDQPLAEQTLGAVLVEGFDLYFLVFIITSRRVRDVFSSFPAPQDSDPQ
jgi:Protein of unknown function (DUF2919)